MHLPRVVNRRYDIDSRQLNFISLISADGQEVVAGRLCGEKHGAGPGDCRKSEVVDQQGPPWGPDRPTAMVSYSRHLIPAAEGPPHRLAPTHPLPGPASLG